MYRETITPQMAEVARTVHARLGDSYYLAGGTALALFSGHRESVDLDYFTPVHINTEQLKNLLLLCFPQIRFTYEEVDTLWCVVNDVKVSFISRFAPLLDTPQKGEGLRLAGVRDLVVMKLNAICGRDEYKDYYDLAELTTITDAREWPALWDKAYPASDPVSWLVALAHVVSVVEVPLKGQAIRSKKAVEAMLSSVVKELSFFV